MQGSQLTIYANATHKMAHMPLVDWVLGEVARCDIQGATVVEASDAIDPHGHYHAVRFFELADTPLTITVAATDARIDALLAHLARADTELFYTRIALEFGELGPPDVTP